MGRFVCFLVVLTLSGFASADERPNLQTQRDLQRQAELAQQRLHFQLSVRGLMPVPQRRMNQILKLSTEKGQLALRTLVAPTPNSLNRRAELEGSTMPVMINYYQFLADHPETAVFELKMEQYPDRLSSVVIDLLWRPGNDSGGELEIHSTYQKRDQFIRVVYQQVVGQAILIGSGNDNSGSQDAQSVTLVEKDFLTLRQKHPVELEQWLRPVFHRLGQDAVFAADSNAAWQVLMEDWPLDAKLRQRVEQVIPQLNSPDWQARHAAADELMKFGRDGATALAQFDRKGLSLEQNVRIDEVLSHFEPLPPAETKPLRQNPNFLLDCLYSDDATVRRLAATRLQKLLGHRLNLNLDAPEPMRESGIEKIRAELKDNTSQH